MHRLIASLALALGVALLPTGVAAQKSDVPPIAGRWDIVVTPSGGAAYPSWLEVEPSGYKTLVGRFVGHFGSSRPIARIDYDNAKFSFAIPPQWEQGANDLKVEGEVKDGTLMGTITDPDGTSSPFTATRAPELAASPTPKWGKPIVLFDGKNLDAWKPKDDRKSNWMVKDKTLVNPGPGADLRTVQTFKDFKLHIEFRYPKSSNSGVYLRGRYEVQINDGDDKGVLRESLGAVYGFLEPTARPASKAGEWQAYDITLVGRTVTIVLNGKTVVSEREIPGITGGALDSDEGAPGPIFLQGDHGTIEYRSITITPAV